MTRPRLRDWLVGWIMRPPDDVLALCCRLHRRTDV